MDLKVTGWRGNDRIMWYRRDSNNRLLWTWQWTSGFHIMQGISWLP